MKRVRIQVFNLSQHFFQKKDKNQLEHEYNSLFVLIVMFCVFSSLLHFDMAMKCYSCYCISFCLVCSTSGVSFYTYDLLTII